MTIYKYYGGYGNARKHVEEQSLDEDLQTIDALFGRDNLEYGATPAEVKQEALRQLEIEYREEVNEDATFWVRIANAQRAG